MRDDEVATVGQLRAKLDGVPDDMPLRGGANDRGVTKSLSVGVGEDDHWNGRKTVTTTVFWVNVD